MQQIHGKFLSTLVGKAEFPRCVVKKDKRSVGRKASTLLKNLPLFETESFAHICIFVFHPFCILLPLVLLAQHSGPGASSTSTSTRSTRLVCFGSSWPELPKTIIDQLKTENRVFQSMISPKTKDQRVIKYIHLNQYD